MQADRLRSASTQLVAPVADPHEGAGDLSEFVSRKAGAGSSEWCLFVEWRLLGKRSHDISFAEQGVPCHGLATEIVLSSIIEHYTRRIV